MNQLEYKDPDHFVNPKYIKSARDDIYKSLSEVNNYLMVKNKPELAMQSLREARDLMKRFLDKTLEVAKVDYSNQIKLPDNVIEVLFLQIANRYDIHVDRYLFTVDKRKRKVFVYHIYTDARVCLGWLFIGPNNDQVFNVFNELVDNLEMEDIKSAFQSLTKRVTYHPTRSLIGD